jgi:hypothetical protein
LTRNNKRIQYHPPVASGALYEGKVIADKTYGHAKGLTHTYRGETPISPSTHKPDPDHEAR